MTDSFERELRIFMQAIYEKMAEHEVEDAKRHTQLLAISQEHARRIASLEEHDEITGQHEIGNLKDTAKFWQQLVTGAIMVIGAAVLGWLFGGRK